MLVPPAPAHDDSGYRMPPVYDASGYHILDPNDNLGIKSKYITLIQEKALYAYLPKGDGNSLALDVGCGYGRLTPVLNKCGWKAIGIDPDAALVEYANQKNGGADYLQGGLPDLPVPQNSASLIMLHNLLRCFLLMDEQERIKGIRRYLKAGGKLIVVENIRDNHPKFFSDKKLIEFIEAEGFELEQRIPVRAGRWWMLFLVRYGLTPEMWLDHIAEYELAKRRRNKRTYRWQYLNIFYCFGIKD